MSEVEIGGINRVLGGGRPHSQQREETMRKWLERTRLAGQDVQRAAACALRTQPPRSHERPGRRHLTALSQLSAALGGWQPAVEMMHL